MGALQYILGGFVIVGGIMLGLGLLIAGLNQDSMAIGFGGAAFGFALVLLGQYLMRTAGQKR